MKNTNDYINTNDHEYYEMLISCQMDGELSEKEELELNEHIAKCSECQKFQSKIQNVSGILNGSTIIVDTEAEKTDGSKIYLDFHKKHFPVMKAAACVLIMLALSITTFVGVNNHNRNSINNAIYEDGAYPMSDTFVSYIDTGEYSTDYSDEYNPLFAYFSYLDE